MILVVISAKRGATAITGGLSQGAIMILDAVAYGRTNRLLARLREADLERLEPHLQPLTLEHKRSLYRAREPIEFVYFVESGVASLVNTLQNGAAAEVGTI